MMRGKKTKLIRAVSELKPEDYSKEPELDDIYKRLTHARQEFAQIFEKNHDISACSGLFLHTGHAQCEC